MTKYEFAVQQQPESDDLMQIIDRVYLESITDLLTSVIEGCRNLSSSDNLALADRAVVVRSLAAAALRELH